MRLSIYPPILSWSYTLCLFILYFMFLFKHSSKLQSCASILLQVTFITFQKRLGLFCIISIIRFALRLAFFSLPDRREINLNSLGLEIGSNWYLIQVYSNSMFCENMRIEANVFHFSRKFTFNTSLSNHRRNCQNEHWGYSISNKTNLHVQLESLDLEGSFLSSRFRLGIRESTYSKFS